MKKAIYNKETKQVTYVEMTQEEIDKAEAEAVVAQFQTELAELKQQLADTDYKAIKYAEGQITEEEYSETKEQRQAWRERINELESEMS